MGLWQFFFQLSAVLSLLGGLAVARRSRAAGEQVNEVTGVLGRGGARGQHPLYWGRASLFTHQITAGNFSLLIDPLRMEDDQTELVAYYQRDSQDSQSNVPIKPICRTSLRVTARYMPPNVTVTCSERAGLVTVVCETRGGFPSPIISWSLQPQEVKSSETPDESSGTLTVRKTALLPNVSQGQTVTCTVSHPLLQEILNGSITVPERCGVGPENQTLPGNDTNNLVMAVILVVLTVFLVCGVVAVLLCRRKASWRTCVQRGVSGEEAAAAGGEPGEHESHPLQ
ncbi:hypothetical protein AGOR_G00057910 [Albula goreensis]|uniref:Ig-like domain-containing protein n=1 Tax=Albula goreensis TaxID=1534307 RepID=A0A8T3DS30_9TELE|nr:hypothetical protein AGOR_G00057910 [Albula goreensis]